MSLHVELVIEKSVLLCQENPGCKLVLVNSGAATASVAHPELNPDVPILRVLDTKTGIETLHKKEPRLSGTDYVPLAPGAKIEFEFSLASIVSLPIPTEYEISALVPCAGARPAESKPVKVRIVPVTPRNLTLVSAAGRWSAVQYGVSVNVASDPPQVVRHGFRIMSEGGVFDARPVMDSHLRAAPIASVPPNGVVTDSHWIGWVENGTVSITHFNVQLGASPLVHWKCVEPELALVAPLVAETPDDSGGRSPGAALVWVGDSARGLSAFQVLSLAPQSKPGRTARYQIGTARPAWMLAHVRATGIRLVTYSLNEAGEATLWWRAWPDSCGGAEARRVATWPGRCLGGGGLLTRHDTLEGACLVQGPQKTGAGIELINWQIDAEGNFSEGERAAMPWGYSVLVSENSIFVGPGGSKFSLLADADGAWSAFDAHGEAKPLPAGVNHTRLPLAAGFLDESQVALVVGQFAQGFKLMMVNGESLPHRHG